MSAAAQILSAPHPLLIVREDVMHEVDEGSRKAKPDDDSECNISHFEYLPSQRQAYEEAL